MRFFTSDTHFGHENILRYCDRPFSGVDHMNESLIRNWNNMVAPTDVVFHLGDVALGPWDRWDSILTRLNGYKILVVGNHDRIFGAMREKERERFRPLYSEWFDEVHYNVRGVWLDNGIIVNMSHFPYDGDSHDGDRYTEYRQNDAGRVLIHGHTHARTAEHGMDARVSKSKRGTLQIHVGVDAWDYRPVSEDEIINLIDGA